MPISILLKPGPRAKFISGTTELVLDASVREGHTISSKVTSFPVETGGDVTDHISPDPDELSIEGFITDSPIAILAGVRDFLSNTGSQTSRSRTALGLLTAIHESRSPITVVTGLKTYEDMALTRIEIPRDSRVGTTLRFTASLRKIRFANSRTIAVQSDQVLDDPVGTGDQATSTADVGKQVPIVADEVTAQQSSLLFDAANGLGLF